MRIEQSINRSLVLNKEFELNGNTYLATVEACSERVVAVKIEIAHHACMMLHSIEFKVNKRLVRFDEDTLYLPEWLSFKNNIQSICKIFYAQENCSILKIIQNQIKSRLLKKAHSIARDYRNEYNSYKEAFAASLELVYA